MPRPTKMAPSASALRPRRRSVPLAGKFWAGSRVPLAFPHSCLVRHSLVAGVGLPGVNPLSAFAARWFRPFLTSSFPVFACRDFYPISLWALFDLLSRVPGIIARLLTLLLQTAKETLPSAPSGPPLGSLDPPAPAANLPGPVSAAPNGGNKRASLGSKSVGLYPFPPWHNSVPSS
jgi:hypothetical protein